MRRQDLLGQSSKEMQGDNELKTCPCGGTCAHRIARPRLPTRNRSAYHLSLDR